jgi:hypothetical protein
MLKRELSVQFAGDGERRGSPCAVWAQNDRDKNKRAFVVVPTLFSPCAYERHAL